MERGRGLIGDTARQTNLVGSERLALGGAHFGLAIMRERVHLLGGELRVESQPGQGTRVIVELPMGNGNGTTTDSDCG